MKKLISILAMLAIVGCAVQGPPEQPIQRRRLEAIEQHPDWKEPAKSWVLKGEVHPGMTGAQAMAAWGATFRRISTTETETRKTLTFYFEQPALLPADDQCPPGRWAVVTESRKKDDGKEEHVVVEVNSW